VFIENYEFFSLATKTPEPIADLLKEIENQTMVDGKHYEMLVNLGRRIRWKWCEVAFNYAYYAVMQKEGKCECV
jgi:hypothetical protein